MLRLVVFVLCFCLPVSVAAAQPVLYDCDVVDRKKVGWVPEKLGIVVAADGSVTVIDPVILHFHKQPMQAQVTRNTEKRLDIRWTLQNVTGGSNQTVDFFDYEVQIDKRTNRIGIWAKPDNYQNRFTGKGTCTPRTK